MKEVSDNVAPWLLTMICAVSAWTTSRVLPRLHPAPLWTGMWTLTMLLFAMHLLPYPRMSGATALVIAGALVSFVVGTLAGQHFSAGLPIRRETKDWSPADRAVLARATIWTGTIAAILLILFLSEVARKYGVSAALRSSPVVRLALESGFASITIKYLYFAIPTAALAALRAAAAIQRRDRRRWLSVAFLAIVSGYFSTGRSTPLLIAIVAVVAYFTGPSKVSTHRIRVAAVGLATLGLTVFLIGGALLGKTLENSPIRAVQSPLTKRPALSTLALPYEYITAPVAALNGELSRLPVVGSRYGCATFAPVCSALHAMGLPVTPESQIRPFTLVPFPWNTYTALDKPLIDGGLILMLPIVFLLGCFSGWVFAWARRQYLCGICVYGVVASAVVFSIVQNNFFAPHIAASMAVIVVAIELAKASRSTRRGSLTAPALPNRHANA